MTGSVYAPSGAWLEGEKGREATRMSFDVVTEPTPARHNEDTPHHLPLDNVSLSLSLFTTIQLVVSLPSYSPTLSLVFFSDDVGFFFVATAGSCNNNIIINNINNNKNNKCVFSMYTLHGTWTCDEAFYDFAASISLNAQLHICLRAREDTYP